jgi:hypothetical protein
MSHVHCPPIGDETGHDVEGTARTLKVGGRGVVCVFVLAGKVTADKVLALHWRQSVRRGAFDREHEETCELV